MGSLRRRILLLAMLAATAFATWVLTVTQEGQGSNPGHWLADGLFAVLFAWVCGGFLTAVMGWWSLRRGDPQALDPAAVAGRPIAEDARTAIVMPVYNEDMASVSACLRATIESLSRAGDADRFDVFILSDSKKPEQKSIEREAWESLRTGLAADGYDASRVHIRWRLRSGRKKAGNVADFCRRWGASFRYMVVLDADSVMSGEALLSMVRLMEAHPRAGIIQTAPRSVGLDSLHARLQQFAGRLTGPLFAAGLRYWQLGDSHYWGHNAILRVKPFMDHCALAPLRGSGGLAGDILSHDFVEAALMRRAGFEVWLLPDTEGSYEQPPAHLIDELQRDRRWCQGNLQNARLITEPGLAPVHRALFVAGAMSYVASPLWLGFVLIGLLPWMADAGMAMVTGTASDGLPLPVMALWASTLVMLLLPRALAVEAVIERGEAEGFGGRLALIRSAALEAVIAAFQAPVRMLAHSVFVIGALTGLKLEWRSPSREAKDIGWRQALGSFGVGGLLAAGVFAWWLAGAPGEAWKLLPMALPLAIAVPLAVWTSRPSVGAAWRRLGWLVTPEESRPPQVLRAAWRHGGRERPMLPTTSTVPLLGSGLAPAPVRAHRAGWGQRTAAGMGLAFGMAAIALPGQIAHGVLGHGEIAAMNIVMQASSPSAEPRVEARGPLPMRRVAAPARATRLPMPMAADSQRI